MKFICIMGRTNSGKSTVEAYLEKMGFKRSKSYTSREPQVRNGKLEQDGVEYNFVTEERFMKLVEKGKIIEYERYGNNLYGTPRPYGATRYVAVVCLGGYKALKQLYGNQVLGVYLKCDDDVALARGEQRDASTELVKKRRKEDEAVLQEMENTADIIIDSNQELNRMLADILKALKSKEDINKNESMC